MNDGLAEDDNAELKAWVGFLNQLPGLSLPSLVALLICTIFSAVGIVGALNYNGWLVAIASISFLLDLAYGVATLNTTMIFLGILLLFPHVMLIREIVAGTMTPETYADEERTCLSCL